MVSTSSRSFDTTRASSASQSLPANVSKQGGRGGTPATRPPGPPFWSPIEELRKIIKEKNKNQSEVQNISTEVENMTKEKDSEIENDLKKETENPLPNRES